MKKIYGTFGVEMRAYGQKLVKFCKHTYASKLVVEILMHYNVVVVRLEHCHSFIESFDNHSTAPGPASCSRRRPAGNAVSGHSSTLYHVVWWLSPQGQSGDAITPHR